MHKNESYDEFRRLLRKGIGTRTQTQFARETGISRGNINRLLNQESFQRPSEKTLLSLASHMHSVTARELLASCGYGEPDINKAALAVRKALEERFSWSIGDVVPGLSDEYFRPVVLPYAESPYRWIHPDDKAIPAGIALKGEKYSLWECIWRYGDQLAGSFLAFGYAEARAPGMSVLCDFTMDPPVLRALLQDAGLSDEPDKESSATFDQAAIRTRLAGKRLMESIFGVTGSGTYPVTNLGCGFYYRETPPGFRDYVIANAPCFCTNRKCQDLYRRLVDTCDDPDTIFRDYDGDGSGSGTGTGSAVAKILSEKTGQTFLYLEKDPKTGEGHEDDSCVMCPEDDNFFDERVPEYNFGMRVLIKHNMTQEKMLEVTYALYDFIERYEGIYDGWNIIPDGDPEKAFV